MPENIVNEQIATEQIVNLSVRGLVEFILRSGDIDTAYLGANRALEGTRIHQQIQKQKKKTAKENNAVYKSEVYLAVSYAYEGILYHIEGRADGIQTGGNEPDAIIVDEIKSTLRPVAQLEPNSDHWHWAQAKCYGYMYLASPAPIPAAEPPRGLTITLTYGQVETGDVRTFDAYFTFDELETHFVSLLEKYSDFARLEAKRLTERNETARALAFPYGAYRRGQRELAVAVYTAIKQKRKLFAQAPTGIGKTISTLFPAVKSLAEGYGDKIFYLTAKTIARQVAEDAFRYMMEKGLRLRAITLTARDKICFLAERRCDPDFCPYAKGHFDRVNAAILDCVQHELLINRPTVEKYARKHSVCPAEYQLDIALFCDGVIGDYNHAYDPKARIQRFFQQGGDYIVLNDEAHNLIDRARDMFSAGLHKNDFSSLRRVLGRKHPLYRIMGAVAKEIRNQWRERPDREPFCLNEYPVTLPPLLFEFTTACDAYLGQGAGNCAADYSDNQTKSTRDSETTTYETPVDETPMESLLTLYFASLDYLRVTELFDEHYAFYCEPNKGYIRLYCLDPSVLLHLEQKKVRACVFFSATLTPLPYFQALLGGAHDDYALRLASPFPRENLCLLVDERISTRYKDRVHTYGAVADRLYDMIHEEPGNYMAFFSSYAYLSEVHTRFTQKYPDVTTRVQTQDMDDESREVFLANFTEDKVTTTAATTATTTATAATAAQLVFVVLGGVFSEGIDLKGRRLIGAAIVGVGLPLISAERNVIMDYYNRFEDKGFAYAYIYPGMNKVLQAAGRVIRTETDRGVVLLIDSRFSHNEYRSLFPPEWAGYTRLRGGIHIKETLRRFWQQAPCRL